MTALTRSATSFNAQAPPLPFPLRRSRMLHGAHRMALLWPVAAHLAQHRCIGVASATSNRALDYLL
jgi:hypothetical protein